MVVHQRRHRKVRHADLARLAQHVKVVLFHRRVERRALGLPIGDKRVKTHWIKHRPRQDMRPNLTALFKHHNRAIGIKLLEPDRSRKPRRARPHDHNIIFHRFARHIRH